MAGCSGGPDNKEDDLGGTIWIITNDYTEVENLPLRDPYPQRLMDRYELKQVSTLLIVNITSAVVWTSS